MGCSPGVKRKMSARHQHWDLPLSISLFALLPSSPLPSHELMCEVVFKYPTLSLRLSRFPRFSLLQFRIYIVIIRPLKWFRAKPAGHIHELLCQLDRILGSPQRHTSGVSIMVFPKRFSWGKKVHPKWGAVYPQQEKREKREKEILINTVTYVSLLADCGCDVTSCLMLLLFNPPTSPIPNPLALW